MRDQEETKMKNKIIIPILLLLTVLSLVGCKGWEVEQKTMIDYRYTPAHNYSTVEGVGDESRVVSHYESESFEILWLYTFNRDEAVHELRQALYEHEDMMEKVFHDDPDLNFEDWLEHRIFVQQMNDIDVGIIKVMPSATGWIPVSERLPKYIKRYLITDKTGYVTIAPFYISPSDGKSRFDHVREVIAWMGLPEAYTKEEVYHE